MKKSLSVLLALGLTVFLLSACGGNSSTGAASAPAAESQTSAVASSSAAAASSEQASSSAAASTEKAAESSESAASSSDSTAADLTPTLATHTSYLVDQDDTYTEYQTVYYVVNSRIMMALADEIHFNKSGGYTKESLEAYDVNEVYANFDKLDFASRTITDDGDYFSYVIRFENLDQPENITALSDNGIIQVDHKDRAVNADTYLDWMKNQGNQEVDAQDYEKIGLHF